MGAGRQMSSLKDQVMEALRAKFNQKANAFAHSLGVGMSI
jgi:hypothetical protein